METLFAIVAVVLFCAAIWYFIIRTPETTTTELHSGTGPQTSPSGTLGTGTGPIRSNRAAPRSSRGDGIDAEEILDVVEDIAVAAHVASEIAESIPERAPEVETKTGLEIPEEESRRVAGSDVVTQADGYSTREVSRSTGLEISESESRRVSTFDSSPSFGGGSSDSGYSSSDSGGGSSDSGGGGSFD